MTDRSGYTGNDVLRMLGGGLGYPEDRLRMLWDQPPFSIRVLRRMRKTGDREPCFGEDFLWALLASKQAP